jgi:hypothetical protein
MAQHTLPVLSFPGFPQVLSAVIDQQIKSVDRVLARQLLTTCDWCSPESSWGACGGGYSCGSTATVHDLKTEQDFCAQHFAEVLRG